MKDGDNGAAHRESLEKQRALKFIRWNGYAMAQFTVVLAMLSGLSVSALGAGITLLQRQPVSLLGAHSLAFAMGMLCFVATILLALLAAITRTLDFRLTARKVRGRLDRTMFGLDDKSFGSISWFLFWLATAFFVVGMLLFVISIYAAFLLEVVGCK